MVFEVEKPSRFAASCCSVLVVNGRGGFLRRSPFFTSATRKSASFSRSRMRFISSSEPTEVPCSSSAYFAVRGFCLPCTEKSASSVQYSAGTNSSISFSRFAISRLRAVFSGEVRYFSRM